MASSQPSIHTANDGPIEVALQEEYDSEESSSSETPPHPQGPQHMRSDSKTSTSSERDAKDTIQFGNTVFKICEPDETNDGFSVVDHLSVLEVLPNLEERTVGGTPRPPTHALPVLSGKAAVIFYLSAFAIIGSSLRTYLGRIFGYDCEFPIPKEQWDYLHPLSTCLTATGLTEQNGGALFIDLPANMLGSLLMGILTPLKKNRPILPWLLPDHRLQNFDVIHLSLRTALCGSLTTFASWNTQMIVMMVGHETIDGSPRIVQAIFGYIIGANCAIACFQVGRHIGQGLYEWRKGSVASSSAGNEEDRSSSRESRSADTDVESQSTAPSKNLKGRLSRQRQGGRGKPFFSKLCDFMDVLVHGKYSPLIFSLLLLALFLVGDLEMDSNFHKKMWMTCLFAPFGTVLRWQLSFLNGMWFRDSKILKYFPVGTFFANLGGCIISIVAAALMARGDGLSETSELLIYAIKVGFAGNLSTVSTFAKEVVLLSEKSNTGPAYFYAAISMVTCCLVSVVLYSTIVKL
jgi:fluoride ion exporter CrcB/FEX